MKVNGPLRFDARLPNTLSISIKGLRASELLSLLGDELAASAGAACHSSQQATVSSVLQAMQVCMHSLLLFSPLYPVLIMRVGVALGSF